MAVILPPCFPLTINNKSDGVTRPPLPPLPINNNAKPPPPYELACGAQPLVFNQLVHSLNSWQKQVAPPYFPADEQRRPAFQGEVQVRAEGNTVGSEMVFSEDRSCDSPSDSVVNGD
nr:hypothetical protein, unlikely [Trypanosoma congolense IL3000]